MCARFACTMNLTKGDDTSNGLGTSQRILLGAAAAVAVVGIGAVAYGATIEPASIAAASAPVVAAVPAADAVPVAATADELSESSADSLVFMREEEKLARDVHLTLADVWGVQVFANIAQAEQTHMDSVLGLLDTYEIADPVVDDSIGVLVDPEIQRMYDDLVGQGSESVEAAFKVGVLIEEVDIGDLAFYVEEVVPADVAMVYERLLSGSENHLRAFTSQLGPAGDDYEPIVLDEDTYDGILASQGQRGGHGGGNGGGQNEHNA
jgi:hypothetical protein